MYEFGPFTIHKSLHFKQYFTILYQLVSISDVWLGQKNVFSNKHEYMKQYPYQLLLFNYRKSGFSIQSYGFYIFHGISFCIRKFKPFKQCRTFYTKQMKIK